MMCYHVIVIAPGLRATTLFNVRIEKLLYYMSSQTAIYHNDNKYMQNRYSEQVILKVLNADNNNNSNIYTIDYNYSNIYTTGSKRHFVICNSCFWCASLYSDSRTVKCPLCNSYSNLELIPLSKNESFKFDYHSRTGIVLEFSRH
jgi:hypothetical protein